MSRNLKIVFCLIVVVALMAGSLTLASYPTIQSKPADGECKFANLECPNVWAPVACKKGGWFENRCYAKRACAKGCRNFFGG